MYIGLLHLHNSVRWLVLIAAVVALVLIFRGLFGRRAWTQAESRASLAYVGLMDVQLVIGLLLYVVSPLVQSAFQDFGAAMASGPLRFFVVEHSFLMLVAVALAHVGSVAVKRAQGDALKFRRAATWFSLSVLAVLVAIPWWRPLFPGA